MQKIAAGIKIQQLTKAVPEKLHHAHCSGVVVFENGDILVTFYWAINEANRNQQIYLTRLKNINSSTSLNHLVENNGLDENINNRVDVKDGDFFNHPRILMEHNWSAPQPMKTHSKFRFDGNPVLWIAPDTKRLWMFYNVGFGWSVCWAKYRYSDDMGVSWSKPKNVYPFISRGVKNPPIMLSKKTNSGQNYYVLPAYVEFKYLRGVCFISKNGGKSWKQSKKIDLAKDAIPPGYEDRKGRQCEQPTIIERKDGSLLCLMRNDGQPLKKMLYSESFDGGFNWSPARNYILPNPAGGFHMIKIKTGEIVIIYNHAPAPNNDMKWRNPLSVAVSEDDGKSWKYRRNIIEWHPENKTDSENKNDSEHNDDFTKTANLQNKFTYEYPTITQGPNGMLHATWSCSHPQEVDGKKYRFTDIQYTSFSLDWAKEREYFEKAWE